VGTYWRVSNYIDLSGEGGRKSSARWHTAGSRVIYLADSPMSALVESLVHLDVDSEDTPDFYALLKISALMVMRFYRSIHPSGPNGNKSSN